jgi:hypothetical protein
MVKYYRGVALRRADLGTVLAALVKEKWSKRVSCRVPGYCSQLTELRVKPNGHVGESTKSGVACAPTPNSGSLIPLFSINIILFFRITSSDTALLYLHTFGAWRDTRRVSFF